VGNPGDPRNLVHSSDGILDHEGDSGCSLSWKDKEAEAVLQSVLPNRQFLSRCLLAAKPPRQEGEEEKKCRLCLQRTSGWQCGQKNADLLANTIRSMAALQVGHSSPALPYT